MSESEVVFEQMKTIVSQEDGGTPRPRSMTVEQFQQVANMFAMELDILFRRFPLADVRNAGDQSGDAVQRRFPRRARSTSVVRSLRD